MKEKIRELLNASPFVPFTIHLASGHGYRVSHPDLLKNRMAAFIP
jgi:hypothetical protein